METILIRYAELRRAAEQVRAYLTARPLWAGPYGLRLRVEEDFGLAGDDTILFLADFERQFRVRSEHFDFAGYITPEGLDGAALLKLPLLLLYLPLLAGAWASQLLLAGLCAPFSRHTARAIGRRRLRVPGFIIPPAPATPKVLRVGDLVASAAVGRFVKREAVRFELLRP